jgi:catechol 2,3-dioxygenase-like lactoylglutathione lyase family enzyme
MPFEIQRSNTILYCRKWAETLDFYRDVLQFPIHFQNDWFVEFEIGNHMFLSIADTTRSTIQSVEGQGLTLAWQVTNITTIHNELNQQGIDVGDLKTKWDATVFYFHDPEGHRIELWEPLHRLRE